MRSAALVCIAFIVACTSGSFVAGVRYMDPISPQPGNNGDIGDKRVDLNGEPSCDELRAMWRYTKRQSRAAQQGKTNVYPMYQEPFYSWSIYPERSKSSASSYLGYGRPRNRAGAPIYGRMVHKAPSGSRFRNGMRARPKIEEMVKIFGTLNRNNLQLPKNRDNLFRYRGGVLSPKVPQSGSFEALRNLIQVERARELQRQHIAEEMEGLQTVVDQDQESSVQQTPVQQSQQLFSKPLPSLQITPDSRYYQRRYPSHVPNTGQAWSRSGPISREYMIR